MDAIGSPNFDARQDIVKRRVIGRLLRSLEPPEALRGNEARQQAHWNEFGSALIRRIPSAMNQGEIECLLDGALDDWFERNRYRTWPMAADLIEPMEVRVKEWYGRQRESEAHKRALPAPATDPLGDFRDEGWTSEIAQRWVERLGQDRDHFCRDGLLGIAKAALQRCLVREGKGDVLPPQPESYFPDHDRHEAARQRSLGRASEGGAW